MQKMIWLSYDLGVQGDYEGLYAWLDKHGAKECGDSTAALKYDYKTDLLAEIKADLAENVEFDKRSRVYVINSDGDSLKGQFVIGSRKSPPWTGYAPHPEDAVDEA